TRGRWKGSLLGGLRRYEVLGRDWCRVLAVKVGDAQGGRVENARAVVLALVEFALGREHGSKLGKALGERRGDLVLRQAFLPAEKLARGAPLEHAGPDSAQAGLMANQFQNLARSGAVDLLARR